MIRTKLFILSLFILSSQAISAVDYSQFVDVPGWVQIKKPVLQPKIPLDSVKDGTYYQLVDSQVQVTREGKVTYFEHFVEHIINPNGVKNSSQLNLDFNPEFQKLVMHKLVVWRKGKKIDKRLTARMTVIQPERESKENIYSGEHSLNIILDDIRVGDTIEYSFSRQGRNPVFNDNFDLVKGLQWGVPVGEVYRRIVWHPSKPLYYKVENTDIKVKTVQKKGVTEYIYEKKNVQPLSLSEKTPAWYVPYAQVYFSNAKTWADVTQWGQELFHPSSEVSPSVATIANKIKAEHDQKQSQIVAALQYVQDKVRYLSLSIGENSHRPAKPGLTLQRRYGDCKDKSALFVAVLSELGIQSYPVLVNTDLQHKISDRIPAYSVFDHAIVQVVHEGQKYWFDPTRQYQSGVIENIYQPDFGYALVIKQGSNALETMHQPSRSHGVIVNETFNVNVKQRDNVKYNVETSYIGLNAEQQRYRLARDGKQSIQQGYLKFYKGYYPGIVADKDIVIDKSNEEGKVLTSERYSIKDFWRENKKTNKLVADFYSSSVSSYLVKPKTKSREHPYSLSHPVTMGQNITVNFSEDDWSFKEEEFLEDNDYFYFKHSAYYDRKNLKLSLKYFYQSKINHVPVEKFKDYLQAVDRANAKIDYGIQYDMSKKSETKPVEAKKTFMEEYAWMIGIIVYGLVIMLGIVLWVYAEKKKPTSSDTLYYPVSVSKFIIMWVLTLGAYSIYWFFKNYSFIKQRDGTSIMPKARGIFSPFWYYPLYKDIANHQLTTENNATVPPVYVGGVLAILYLLSNISAGLDYHIALMTLVTGLLILPMVNYVFHINESNSKILQYNSGYGLRHLVLFLIASPLLFVVVASDTGLIPSDKVVSGDTLYNHDLKFMQRNGIVSPGDKIAYFYSDAFISIRDDGNGFTDRHVFSYWKEEGDMKIEVASYSEIADINVTWAKSVLENTVVKIIRKDGSYFLQFAAREKGRDKLFVNELKRKWRETK